VNKSTSGKDGNGAGASKPAMAAKPAAAAKPAGATVATAAPRKPMRPGDARQARFAQSFAQIVAVLMRDPNLKKLPLGDLEWLVLPPVMAGQFKLAQMPMAPAKSASAKAADAKAPDQGKPKDEPGVLVPVAVALWARVSDNIDKALQGNLDKQARLHAADWASGNNIWLMTVAGDQRAIPKFVEQLGATEFKGKLVKMRMRGADGKVVVRTMTGGDKPQAKAAPQG
jgi:cytolysin-activating lysine-acyltransferase